MSNPPHQIMLQAKQLSRLTELEASGPALKATFCESSRKILKDAFPIKKDALPLGRTPQKTLERVAGLILCALAHSISKAASALRISFDFVPYCFVDVYKLDFLFRKYSMRFCVAFCGDCVRKKGSQEGKTTMGLFPSCY